MNEPSTGERQAQAPEPATRAAQRTTLAEGIRSVAHVILFLGGAVFLLGWATRFDPYWLGRLAGLLVLAFIVSTATIALEARRDRKAERAQAAEDDEPRA